MNKLNRRSMLGRWSALAAAPLMPLGRADAQEKRSEPDRKLRIVAVGGHSDDPQTCAGGTLALFADQGHDVVGLSLAGGPPPPPDANSSEHRVRSRLDAMRMAQILKIRLDCLNYGGSNSGQSGGPIVYRSACEISGQRYKEFTARLSRNPMSDRRLLPQ